jgi:hypothetical protein
VLTGAALLGSFALGFNIGQTISGEVINVSLEESGLSFYTRKMCDAERSRRWGQNAVGISVFTLGALSGPRGHCLADNIIEEKEMQGFLIEEIS